jgi:hypothetical protein
MINLFALSDLAASLSAAIPAAALVLPLAAFAFVTGGCLVALRYANKRGQ